MHHSGSSETVVVRLKAHNPDKRYRGWNPDIDLVVDHLPTSTQWAGSTWGTCTFVRRFERWPRLGKMVSAFDSRRMHQHDWRTKVACKFRQVRIVEIWMNSRRDRDPNLDCFPMSFGKTERIRYLLTAILFLRPVVLGTLRAEEWFPWLLLDLSRMIQTLILSWHRTWLSRHRELVYHLCLGGF